MTQVNATERFSYCIERTLCISGDSGESLYGSPGSFDGTGDPPASWSCVQAPSPGESLGEMILPAISSNVTSRVAWDGLKSYAWRQERK